jgi:hypothetical protein
MFCLFFLLLLHKNDNFSLFKKQNKIKTVAAKIEHKNKCHRKKINTFRKKSQQQHQQTTTRNYI